MKNSLIVLIISLGLLITANVLSGVLVGGRVIHLASGSALEGQVSQSLGPNSEGTLLVNRKDYTYSVHYLDNNTWVIVKVKPLNTSFNASTIVMQKRDGIFQVALGPGSAFTSTQLQSLPEDVVSYLSQISGTYTPVVE